ncbi:unknown [Clostridium sp. CAG:921]|nr:unknown [Clostridium sp. CAG:921]
MVNSRLLNSILKSSELSQQRFLRNVKKSFKSLCLKEMNKITWNKKKIRDKEKVFGTAYYTDFFKLVGYHFFILEIHTNSKVFCNFEDGYKYYNVLWRENSLKRFVKEDKKCYYFENLSEESMYVLIVRIG